MRQARGSSVDDMASAPRHGEEEEESASSGYVGRTGEERRVGYVGRTGEDRSRFLKKCEKDGVAMNTN